MKTAKKLLIFLLLVSALLPKAQAAEEKWVALTFDDGPSEWTQTLLDGLAEREVTATFFLCGCQIRAYPEQASAVARAGHELGVHGYSHEYFHRMTDEALREELSSTAELIGNPTLLRPPGGLFRENTEEVCRERGWPVILWSLDPEDWDPKQRKYTVSRVVQGAKNGDIILLHDLSAQNAQSALSCIDRLKEKGFRFCTVSELAEKAGVTMEPGKIYRSFPFELP